MGLRLTRCTQASWRGRRGSIGSRRGHAICTSQSRHDLLFLGWRRIGAQRVWEEPSVFHGDVADWEGKVVVRMCMEALCVSAE